MVWPCSEHKVGNDILFSMDKCSEPKLATLVDFSNVQVFSCATDVLVVAGEGMGSNRA